MVAEDGQRYLRNSNAPALIAVISVAPAAAQLAADAAVAHAAMVAASSQGLPSVRPVLGE